MRGRGAFGGVAATPANVGLVAFGMAGVGLAEVGFVRVVEKFHETFARDLGGLCC